MKRRERRAWVSQSGGVDAKCLQSMSGRPEKLADKSYAGTLHSTSLFLSIEPISLSLSRFCPVFSPPPFHHPLVEPRRFSSASSLFFSPAPPPPSPASLCTDDFYQTQGREMTFVHFSNCDRERTVNENRAFGERRIGAKNKGKHESCENLIVN